MTATDEPGEHHLNDAGVLAPLGPESLTWKLFGDSRSGLLAGRTATLQAMHPGVGAVLWDSSMFRWELADRLLRSASPIMGVIYDDPARATGRAVRDLHKGKVGTDTSGRSWHALRPELFYWVHATFVESMVTTQEHFGTPLTLSEKDQLIAESPAYWAAYGVRAPREHWVDWADFEAYWNHTIESELERNKTTDFVFPHKRCTASRSPENLPPRMVAPSSTRTSQPDLDHRRHPATRGPSDSRGAMERLGPASICRVRSGVPPSMATGAGGAQIPRPRRSRNGACQGPGHLGLIMSADLPQRYLSAMMVDHRPA